MACPTIVVFAQAILPETNCLVEASGGTVGRAYFQATANGPPAARFFQDRQQQYASQSFALICRVHRQVVDTGFIENTGIHNEPHNLLNLL